MCLQQLGTSHLVSLVSHRSQRPHGRRAPAPSMTSESRSHHSPSGAQVIPDSQGPLLPQVFSVGRVFPRGSWDSCVATVLLDAPGPQPVGSSCYITLAANMAENQKTGLRGTRVIKVLAYDGVQLESLASNMVP